MFFSHPAYTSFLDNAVNATCAALELQGIVLSTSAKMANKWLGAFVPRTSAA